MPLAIRPSKGPVRAHSGSVWINWGSYLLAKSTISSSLRAMEPYSRTSPAV